MSRTDQWANSILVLLLLLYASVWAYGYFTNRLLYVISFLNLATGIAIIVYWVVKQLQIQQHFIEGREVAVLCFELIVIGTALYGIFSGHVNNWLKVTQYTFFGIHFLVLIGGLIFMLTFKMNRLI